MLMFFYILIILSITYSSYKITPENTRFTYIFFKKVILKKAIYILGLDVIGNRFEIITPGIEGEWEIRQYRKVNLDVNKQGYVDKEEFTRISKAIVVKRLLQDGF